jgi:hypothetical protein
MTQDTQFLDRALTLVANGYRIIPIKPGEKRPALDDWQDSHATVGQVKKWASNGFANGNIGIITANNPAIDLDIYDAEMAEKMEAWCLTEFGAAPVRIGRAPKRLLMFYADKPFAKVYADYKDSRGTKHRVEVLGQGQQFVAYGIHPETKQPFRWTTTDQPLVSPADMLPLLTVDQARSVVEQFGTFAKSAGWTFVNGSVGGRRKTDAVDDDDALMHYKRRLKITKPEIEHALQYVPDADDYDRWVMVGMALHHQSQGHPAGLAMWHEWSSTAHNYDPDALDKKWQSFHDAPDNHVAVTFASVLKIANEREKVAKTEEFNRLLNVLRTCNDENEIFGPIAKELAVAVSSDWQMDMVAKKIQDRVLEITSVKPRIETVRKALAASTSRGELMEKGKQPPWCKGWVYLKSNDRFYHVDSKSELTEKGFNAVYDRVVLSEEDRMLGVAVPSSRAAALALNIHHVPTVDHTVYLPGFDKIVEIDGRTCANTFDETSVPAAKAPETDDEFAALAVVQKHFEVLLPDPLERSQVLDYLAYSVQFPAEKIVWGIVMQGAEGAGKTFISVMMARILGSANVGPVSATELQDKFTGWAEGRKLIFIEEIRLHGSNRYEVLDKMKPYVSNEQVTIRKMNCDSYDIPNVANYVMFTNYWDGLPFSRMDRRYYVVATSFQTKEQLDAWNIRYPNYFTSIFSAVRDHADVLRHWLLTRSFGEQFQPKRPALDSSAKIKMRDLSDGSDEADALSDVLDASTDPEVSYTLVNADKLKAAMENAGALVPYGRAFNALLAKAGFHSLGRFKVDPHGPNVRFYTRRPELFPAHRELDAIRQLQQGDGNITAFDSLTHELDPFS